MTRLKALLVLLLLPSLACAAAQNLLVTPTPFGAKALRIQFLYAPQDATAWLRYYEDAKTATVQKQKPDQNGFVNFVVPATGGGYGDSYGFQFALSESRLDEMKTLRIPGDVSRVVLEYDVARDTLKILEGNLIVTVTIPLRP